MYHNVLTTSIYHTCRNKMIFYVRIHDILWTSQVNLRSQICVMVLYVNVWTIQLPYSRIIRGIYLLSKYLSALIQGIDIYLWSPPIHQGKLSWVKVNYSMVMAGRPSVKIDGIEKHDAHFSICKQFTYKPVTLVYGLACLLPIYQYVHILQYTQTILAVILVVLNISTNLNTLSS